MDDEVFEVTYRLGSRAMFEARRRFRRHRTVQRLVAGVSGADEGEVTIRAWVDGSGIRVEDGAGRRDTPWSALTDVAADEHTILFVRDGLPVAYLPTDALASDGEARRLVAYAREQIARAAEGDVGAAEADVGAARRGFGNGAVRRDEG